MRFFGRLHVDGERSNWLRADVCIDRHRMVLMAGGHQLGSWPLAEVRAERLEGDQFELHLGGERTLFAADDALAFSYEALPLMGKGLSIGSVASKVRTVFGREKEAHGATAVEKVTKVASSVALEEVPMFPEMLPLGTEPQASASEGSRLRMLVAAARQAAPVEAVPEQLTNLYQLLDDAIADVRSGRITPDQGIAIAELAKAACLAVYARDDSQIDELAARLLAPA